MKKLMRVLFIVLLLSVLLAGCGDADMEGIVLKTTENYIQVATEISPDEYEEFKINRLHRYKMKMYTEILIVN